MQSVPSRKALGVLILATAIVQGCATTATEQMSEKSPLMANSSYVANSAKQIVMSSSNDCVRTISWDTEKTIVECNSSAKGPVAMEAPAPKATMVSYNGRALFAFDSARLTAAGQRELNQLTAKLNGQNTIKQIEIVGHADSVGTDNYNMSLSEQRAESVKRYLQQSLRTVSVVAKGMGEASPVANNSTNEGRRLNRRVDVNIAAAIEQ